MKKLCFVFTLMLFATTSHGGAVLWNIATWEEETGYWGYLEEHNLTISDGSEYGYVTFWTKVTTSEEQANLNDFRWGGGDMHVHYC